MSVFIVVEGIDGSGKTTFCKKLGKEIEKMGYSVFITEEPTRGPYGREIKKKLKEDIDPVEAVLLFALDRYFHLREIKEELEKGNVVILDRYVYSTLAYQGSSLQGRMKDPEEYILRVHSPFMIKEDLAFLIDLPAEDAIKRISGREVKECYEKLEFLRKVRESYLNIAKKFGLKVLDGRKGAEELVEEAMIEVRRVIYTKKSL